MEWILLVVGIYLIGAIYTSWQCEKWLPDELENRTALIVWSSLVWPVGLIIYFLNPELKKQREALNQELEEARAVRDEEQAKLKAEAEQSYTNTKEFMLMFLRKQRDQLQKNLDELGDDDAGRAIIEESIEKTDTLLSRHTKPFIEELELLNK